MRFLNLLYHLRANKVHIWKNDNSLSYVDDKNNELSEYVKDSLKQSKSELLEILFYNGIDTEEKARNTIFYKIPEFLQDDSISAIQKAIYIQHNIDVEKHTYNIPTFIHFKNINIEALKKAITYFLEKHSIIRMSLDEDFRYKTLGTNEFQIKELYVTADEIENLCKQKSIYEFNLDGGKLIDIEIIKIKDSNEAILNLTHHHILADAYSANLIITEILSTYEKLSNNEKLDFIVDSVRTINYFDYVTYQNYELQTKNYKMAIEYLSSKLDKAEALQLKKIRSPTFDNQGDSFDFVINIDIYKKIKQISLDNQVSLYSILLTSLYHVLSVYAGGQTNFPVGLTVSNRPFELNSVIGPFISTLPLILEYYNADKLFIDNIKKVNQEIIYLNEYQQINLNLLTENLSRSHQNIADLMHIMFTMHNFKQDIPNINQAEVEIISIKDTVEQFGISITAKENDNKLSFNVNYAKNLYSLSYVKEIFDSFALLLSTIDEITVAMPVNQISLLSKEDYQKIIYTWNQTDRDYASDKTIHSSFEEQVEQIPNNIALIYENIELTYRELNNKANRLANYLIKNYIIESDTLVVLCLDRSEYIIISILAVLKAGGAYVPIEPSYPNDRVKYIFEDTQTKIVLTNEIHKQKLENIIQDNSSNCTTRNQQTKILAIDNELVDKELLLESKDNLYIPVTSSNLAYVIYTSGTTGNPKGVLQLHSNVIRLFTSTKGWYGFKNDDVWTLFHSYVFDFSVWEIWGALIYGGKLVIPSYEQTRDLTQFYDLCESEKVTILNQTPSAFYHFLDIANTKINKLIHLRYVIFGGEALNTFQLQSWFSDYGYNHPKLINMYGITETTVHATYKPIEEKDLIDNTSIGKMLPDLKAYVLNSNLIPLPIGAVGELYIGGNGIAKGYLNRKELTIEKFINNPFQSEEEKKVSENARLYKTGDLVRWLPNSNLEYIGRNDLQVKIRGYRIELEEIASSLSSYKDIKQSVVLAKEYKDSGTVNTGNKYLVAYYVSEIKLDNQNILKYLRSKLPEYMIPSWLVHLAKLPLTINGKLDRKALPEPEFNYLTQS